MIILSHHHPRTAPRRRVPARSLAPYVSNAKGTDTMSYADWKARLATGNAFDDDDVARCYAHRPPYAPALYDRLLEFVPRRHQLVDLGCGPGKVAAALAPHFARTLALDPAAAMVDHAKRLHPNIDWLHAHPLDAARRPVPQ